MTGEADRARVPAWVWGVCALLVVAITTVSLALTRVGSDEPTAAPPRLSTAWLDGRGSVSAHGVARGNVLIRGDLPPQSTLEMTVDHAAFASVPRGCLASTAAVRRSWISSDGRTLHCVLGAIAADAPRAVAFSMIADHGSGELVTGTATVGGTSIRLAARPITVGVKARVREFRLLSSPDFLNADVADLSQGSDNFDPSHETNGINGYYETALDTVLSDWASKQPDDVTVAGDLVDGHWGVDPDNLSIFGPVQTPEERRAAVRRAGNLYYSQWAARLAEHGLTNIHPAMGDHEYGDDGWPRWKLNLSTTYRDVWASHFTKSPDGRPLFEDRPRRSAHEFSAYAWRPRPDVQMVTLDEFTRGTTGMLLQIDRQQRHWLVRVLRKARADGVRWVVVQGHLPILGPVRMGASSGLQYADGAQSALWRIFAKYGVDIYLCGEVHDVTAIQRNGVLQLSHGGIFQVGRSNYLLADFYASHVDLNVYDYDFREVGPARLWETAHTIAGEIVYEPDPGIIGTARLWSDGDMTRVSGALAPYVP